jgi:hypothetical protein
MGTLAQARILGAFTAGQGFHQDGDYSARSWLINHTRVTAGAAAACTERAKRAGAHPRVAAALATGDISESAGRKICEWTGRLPPDCQDAADAILVAAALSGAPLEDLARLAAEIDARSLPGPPRQAQGRQRPHQRHRLRAPLFLPPPGRHPPVGLRAPDIVDR